MEDMENSHFMQLEIVNSYDVTQHKHVESFNIKLNMKSIRQGLIKDLGVYGFAVLNAIASYCDTHGECFPTQQNIADITGISRRKVITVINDLLNIKIDGVPLLEKRVESRPNKPNFNVYALYGFKEPQLEQVEEKQIAAGDTDIQKSEPKTAKDFIGYFIYKYEQTYGIAYTPNYGRDGATFKNKLMSKMSSSEIVSVIDYAIEHYREKWAKQQYPYPTIGMLGTWLTTQILQDMAVEREEQEKLQNRINATANHQAATYDDFDNI